jgi:hypothetical protein
MKRVAPQVTLFCSAIIQSYNPAILRSCNPAIMRSCDLLSVVCYQLSVIGSDFASPANWLYRYPDITCRDLTLSPVCSNVRLFLNLYEV